jgi:hypothetical protein
MEYFIFTCVLIILAKTCEAAGSLGVILGRYYNRRL